MPAVKGNIRQDARAYVHEFIVQTDGSQACQQYPELFYSENAYEQRRAKVLCEECPFFNSCRLEGLVNADSFGVWGGLSKPDRKRLGKAGRAEEIRRLRLLTGKW